MNRLGFLKRLVIGGMAAPLGQAIATTLGQPPLPKTEATAIATTKLTPTVTSAHPAAAPSYRLQTSPIRGYRYRSEPTDLARLTVGDTLSLQAEPENPYDPSAVRVIHDGKHIGYLPRENNHHASRLLQQGARLTASVKSIHPTSYHWEPIILDIHLHL